MAAAPKHAAAGREWMARLNTSLLNAAYWSNTEEAQTALLEGADVASVDNETGLTALHFAAGNNNLPLVRVLIEEWASPFVTDNFGRWPSVVALQGCATEQLYDYLAAKEAEALGLPD